ncbi:MAG TPA: 2-oxo acid dehydrogenase subunit E2, partial [Candidatus Limnocylindria bacterium]
MPPAEQPPQSGQPSTPPTAVERALDEMNVVNAGYVAELYEQFRRDPSSVEGEWRALFESGLQPGAVPPPAGPAAEPAGNGVTASEPAAAPSLPAGATPLKGPAARLAKNMAASLAVPTATSFRDTPVATLEERRRALNAQVAPKKISFTHLIGWAIVRAASEQPAMSHYFVESDGTAHRVDPGAVNLGLAVDVERADGSHFLVVPVIKAADSMDFGEFHARYEELVEKARGNKLSPDDYVGATITLTNPGTLGTTASVPRLMPGQGTIVATGAIRDTGAGRVMTLTSTYDHRIIQGAESGTFLGRIEALLAGADGFYDDLFSALDARAEQAPAAEGAAAAEAPSSGSASDLKDVAAAVALVRAYRSFGHRAAQLDPLGSPPPGDPALDPGPLGLTPESMAHISAALLRVDVPGATLAEVVPALQATYCGSIAYEVEHIASHEERVWLRKVIESGEHRRPLDPA